MRRAFPVSLALVLGLLLPPVLRAEAAQGGGFGEQLTVSEVLLDVLVTDRQGNVIVGLQPDDFIVEEDGKPVEVAALSFYSNRRLLDAVGGQAAAGSPDGIAPSHRYFVLFFEEQQQKSSDVPELGLVQRQLAAARESRRWIKQEKLLDDYVAVVSYDVRLKVHQDFTQDSAALLRAVDGASTGKDPGANWPSRQSQEEGVPSLRAALPSGAQLGKETGTVYEALSTLARAMDGIVGRKNLVLFATGFGDETAFNLYKPDPRYMPATVQALNNANVAVYSIDLVPSEVEYAESNGLHQLADETGGRYYENFTSFITPLRQLASENNGYYLLSYKANHPAGETGYQRVKVKTRNPEFRIQAREGYEYGG